MVDKVIYGWFARAAQCSLRSCRGLRAHIEGAQGPSAAASCIIENYGTAIPRKYKGAVVLLRALEDIPLLHDEIPPSERPHLGPARQLYAVVLPRKKLVHRIFHPEAILS